MKIKLFIQRIFREVGLLAFLFSFIQRSICVVGLCILLPTVSSAQVIAAGGNHSFAVCSDSTVRSWGLNGLGQLGIGSCGSSISTPIQVDTVTGIIAVASQTDHSIFLKNDSTVWACGSNDVGQIGVGTAGGVMCPCSSPNCAKTTPVRLNSLSGIIAVDCGSDHSLFLKNDSTVWACGSNKLGRLGVGDTLQRNAPAHINSLTGIIAIAGGGGHSLFLKNDGTVWACGWNYFGQLGIGTADNNPHPTPVQVQSLTGIIAVACKGHVSLFLKNDSTVWACGYNLGGAIGDGTTTDRWTPVQVNSLTGILAVACGGGHSLFLKNDGTVWACGINYDGRLGDGTNTNGLTPVQVNSLTGITAVSAGDRHSLFQKNDGTVWACGGNVAGQLGDGTTTNKNTPVQVTGLCPMTTGITEPKQENGFQIYPNPTTGQFTIALGSNNNKVDMTITDITGKVIYTTISTDTQKVEVNTEDFATGIYIVQIQAAGFIGTKKLVVGK
jgi:alpha-tubulin suppressor-like RCC1 family protein